MEVASYTCVGYMCTELYMRSYTTFSHICTELYNFLAVTLFYSLMHTFLLFCIVKAITFMRNDDPTRKDSSIHRFKYAGICHCCMFLPSILFFLSSRIIFSSASLSYDPTILCFSSLPYVSAIFFCRIGRFSKVH